MSELHLALLVGALSLACVVAGFLGHHGRRERRDVRLLLGTGAALGGGSLILLSLS